MKTAKKYYSMAVAGNTATINIYGDITSWPRFEGDVSASNLSKQLEELSDVTEIDVYINSYGGEVAEGLAIYNALKRHSAKIKTYCDGFACSIASVIFMAGDERIMNESSLLMIHNAWSRAVGNAAELRKQADDLEKITQASVIAYKAHSNLSEEEIKALMDAESWLLPSEALEHGFATAIAGADQEQTNASQSVKMRVLDIFKRYRAELEEDEPDPDDEPEATEAEDNPPDGDEPEDEDNPEPDDEPDKEPDDEGEPEKNTTEETAQKWSGFFNALLKG